MADDHIIRVIIQGYNRLSGVLKDAVNKAGPELDKLNTKLDKNQKESDKAANEFHKMTESMRRDGSSIDNTRVKLERLGDSVDKFRNKIKGSKRFDETSGELFDRLRKEGRQPRQGTGFSPFVSREDFITQENARRSRQRVDGIGKSIDNVRNKIRGSAFGGSVISGFQTGKAISRDDDTEIQKRIQAANNFRTTQREEIRLQLKKDELAATQQNRREAAIVAARTAQERSVRDREIADLKEQFAAREEQIKKEIDAAREIKNSSSLAPDRIKALNKEIEERKQIIADESSALDDRLKKISRDRDESVKDLEKRRKAILDGRVEANKAAKDTTLSKEERDSYATRAKGLELNRQERTKEIDARKALAAQEIESAKKEAQIKIDAAQKSLNSAREELKSGKNTPADISAANEIIRAERSKIKDEKSNLDERVRVINEEHRAVVESRKATLSDALKNEKFRLQGLANAAKAAIPGSPTRADAIGQFYTARNQDISGLNSVEKAAAKTAFAIEDFKRGLNGGKRDLADFRGEAGKNQSPMAKFGAEIGKATQNLGKLVNIRWNLILGAVQVLGTSIVELGAGLVSLASSAVFAGAALGGALLAGLTQAVPVVGLLAAAFHELQNAIKVVQLRQRANNMAGVDAVNQAKAQKSAIQQLADAHYALKQAQQGVADADRGIRDAHERVTEALKNQKQSVIDLAKARRDAGRAIIDAAFAERDAELSLRDANLSVLDAKQKLKDFEDKARRDKSEIKDAQSAVKEAQARLAAVKQQGDIIEIAQATAALSAAQNNVSTLQDSLSSTETQHKQLQLGVQQSILTQQRARVTLTRARVDNRERQKQGVAGSPEVKAALDAQTSANKTLRDAIEGVAAAERRRADAEHSVAQAVRGIANAQGDVVAASDKMSAAQRNAQREFNKLSLPEKTFVQAIERLIKAYKKLIRPLTDVIISAFTRLIDSVIKILKDPQIQAALKLLATQIGKGIDRFGAFLSNPETRRQLTIFITEAARNMPKIVDLFLSLFKLIMNIGEAAAPIFSSLLGGADNLLNRAERWTRPNNQGPTGNVRPDDRGGALGVKGTVHNLSPLQKFLDTAAKNLTSWLKLIGAITRFFAYLFNGGQASGNSLVQDLTKAFNHWANWLRDNPKKVHKFFEDARSALHGLGKILSALAKALVQAFSSKGAQAYTAFILTAVVPAILLLLTFMQEVSKAFLFVANLPVVGPVVKLVVQLGLAYALLTKLFPALKIIPGLIKTLGGALLYTVGWAIRFVKVAKEIGIIQTLAAAFPRLAAAIRIVGLALRYAFITNPWVAAIVIAIAIIVLLLRHFHLLWPVIRFLEKVFKDVFKAVINALKIFAHDVVELFTHPIRFLKDHWKGLLIGAVMGPFGAILLLLGHFFPGLQKAVVDGFIGAFKKLADWFKGIGKWLYNHIIRPIENFFGIASPSKLMYRLGMNVVNGFLDAIRKLPGLVLGIIKGLPGKIVNLFKGLGNKIKNAITSTAKRIGGAIAGAFGFGDNKPHGTDESRATIVNQLRRLKSQGVSKSEAISREKRRHPGYIELEMEVFAQAAGYATGGRVRPDDKPGIRGAGDSVPAWLTPGEWILNKAQQYRVSQRLGMTLEAARMFIFGSRGASPNTGTVSGRGVVSENGRQEPFPNFDLVTNTDSTGAVVNFIQLRDGTWGQVTARAAKKIRATNGSWLPGYVSRANKHLAARGFGSISQGFSRGGVVSFASPMMGYANGGVIKGHAVNSPTSNVNVGPRHLNQNFDVKILGNTDWQYVFALGAQKAQESY